MWKTRHWQILLAMFEISGAFLGMVEFGASVAEHYRTFGLSCPRLHNYNILILMPPGYYF